MNEQAAEWIWLAAGAYAVAGLVTALVALGGGLRRFDPLAADASWRTRLLIAPGLVALWPVIARRMAGARPREDRR